MGKDVNGIKGNIYCNADLNQDETRIFDVIERVVLGLFCMCAVAVIVAQIVMRL